MANPRHCIGTQSRRDARRFCSRVGPILPIRTKRGSRARSTTASIYITGNITGSNGRGHSRKWVVFFPVFNKSKEFSSRSLAIEEVSVHTTSIEIASAARE